MRWRKVAGDLRAYRRELGLILAVLVLGIAGVVAALNARTILAREIAGSFARANVADLSLWFDRVDPALLEAISAFEGVAAIDRRRVIATRIAARDGAWMPARITIRADLGTQRLDVVHRHGEGWAHPEGGVFVEQSGETLVDARMGGIIKLRRIDGTTAELPFAGFVHDTAVAPSTQDRMFYAFATPAAAERLGHPPALDQVLVKLKFRGSTAEALEVGTRINAKLRERGSPAFRVEVLPATHPHGPLMNAMLRILEILSAIAFVCSAALAGYLVSAWMRREVRSVGVMKTLGARSHQVAAQYIALAAPLLLAAVAIALPLGVVLGRALAEFQVALLNIDVASWSVPAALIGKELALAIGIPFLAVALPIVRAARLTPLAAIQDPGILPPSLSARMASKVLRFPGAVGLRLALRNVFRRPWRLLVMVLALAAGGTLMMTSMTNYRSLMGAVDRALATQGHDVEVLLQRGAPAAEVEAIARAVPGVTVAEAWRRATVTATRAPAAGSERVEVESARFSLVGYPPGSRLFTLPVVEGRAPRPDAADEVLATRAVQDRNPHAGLGREVDLRFRERQSRVRVVGLVEQIGSPAMYAPPATFEAVTGLGDLSTSARVKSTGNSLAELARSLDQAFLDARRIPSHIITRQQVRESLDEHFYVVGDIMRAIALAAALVGAIVLGAATAFNVFERSRETGVLRAIGAQPRRIAGIFLVEAMAVLAASMAIATAASLALSRAILDRAESMLLRVTVPLQFSWEALAWLAAGAIVILACVALALARTLRKSVRETLTHE